MPTPNTAAQRLAHVHSLWGVCSCGNATPTGADGRPCKIRPMLRPDAKEDDKPHTSACTICTLAWRHGCVWGWQHWHRAISCNNPSTRPCYGIQLHTRPSIQLPTCTCQGRRHSQQQRNPPPAGVAATRGSEATLAMVRRAPRSIPAHSRQKTHSTPLHNPIATQGRCRTAKETHTWRSLSRKAWCCLLTANGEGHS